MSQTDKKQVVRTFPFATPIEFDITVPNNYVHETQVDTAVAKAKDELTTLWLNKNFNSANFAKASNKLVPGKTYNVKIFPIWLKVSATECLDFLQAQPGCILTGAHGLTLVYDLAKEKLPKGKFTTSFDLPESLSKAGEGLCPDVPHILAMAGGPFEFDFAEFALGTYRDFDEQYCLLCICEKPI